MMKVKDKESDLDGGGSSRNPRKLKDDFIDHTKEYDIVDTPGLVIQEREAKHMHAARSSLWRPDCCKSVCCSH